MTSTTKLASAGVAMALGAGALASVGLAGTAHAAIGSTAGLKGSPANHIQVVDYGQTAPITLTAVQNGSDIDVAVGIAVGPNNGPVSAAAAGSYRLDAFVRLGGVENTRGVRFPGTPGAVDVDVNAPLPATNIVGKFVGVGAGTFTLTLTDILNDSNGPSSGAGFGTKADGTDALGFDVWYNNGSTPKGITNDDNPVTPGHQTTSGYSQIGLKESVSLVGVAVGDRVGPTVKVGKIAKKAAKVKSVGGTVKDATAAQSVSIQAVQKVKGKWLAYNGKKWNKKANKAKAIKAAAVLQDTSVTSGKWKVKIKGVQKGKFILKYTGSDTLGNVAKTKTKTAKLK